jgi:hypothetical protein
MYRFLWIALVVWIAAAPAGAAQWPATMQIGGFSVTGIKGTTNPDGSGRASGRVSIPGDGDRPVDLARTASGVVTGSMRGGFSLSGVRVDGSFLLDRRGLVGTGVVRTGGRPITDANLTLSPGRGVSGRGRVSLGSGLSVAVTCDVGNRGVSVRGSAPRQVSVDTPLAVYTFKGDVDLSASGTDLVASAKGNIERKGKIGGMVSTFGPLSFKVDVTSGQASVNVGGTDITIDLW